MNIFGFLHPLRYFSGKNEHIKGFGNLFWNYFHYYMCSCRL